MTFWNIKLLCNIKRVMNMKIASKENLKEVETYFGKI